MRTLLGLLLALAPAAAAEEPIVISSLTVSSPYDLIRGTAPYNPDYTPVPWYPEELEYEVKWGILMMGYADLQVTELVDFNGQPAYHVVSHARTTAFADKFYKVRDLNESWIHVGDLRSLGYQKKLREGKFFRDEWVVYDYDRKTFVSKRINRDASFSYKTGSIPGEVQDILSAMYFIRPRELKVGDEITLDVNTKSNWPLVIKVLRRKTVKVPAGRFRTVEVEPFLRKEGIFIQKGKRLRVYLTNDKRHIPVLMKVEIIFGHISAYLTKIKRRK